jgi:hypothetical protein
MTTKFIWKFEDRSLNSPIQQVQSLQLLESALYISALNQALDCFNGPMLPTHPDEYRRDVVPRFCKPEHLVDEGFETNAGDAIFFHAFRILKERPSGEPLANALCPSSAVL